MQPLGAVTLEQLKSSVKVPKYKFEIYYGGVWVEINNLGGVNYLKDFSLSLGGATMSPRPVAGTWSATIINKNGVFYPANPNGLYKEYFTTGRKVRISFGGTFGGVDVYWERLRGVMDSPSFDAVINGNINLKGMDFMQYLADYKLRKPNNYWGSNTTISTLDPIEVLLAEIYAENDALEIGAGEANTVASWTPSAGITISSFADVGGGSTYVMKAILASGSTPTVDTYATAGAFQWLCPAGVLSVDAEVWAGGGGGAGADLAALAAGGAGGGAYSKKISIAVTPGQLYSVIVGAAGSAGSGGAGATPTVETFLASGASNWVCPAGVYYIDVELWGGGGGSGASDTEYNAAGGGGGGGYSKKRIYVTPGTSYAYSVGIAGIAGLWNGAQSGGNGGDSYFTDVATALAKGGTGGQAAAAGRAGGAGGILGIGDTRYTGGNGGNGFNGLPTFQYGGGGGGGSSAGTASNGNNGGNGGIFGNGNGGAAGVAVAGGGIGGEGADFGDNGHSPISGNGGGAGGASSYEAFGAGKLNGAAGKCGKMVLTYSISNAGDGTDGGDSSFVDLITLLAKGGSKGLKSGIGGNGGALGSGVGDTKYSGGNGGSGYQGAGGGGGGGSSAGTAANGGNGGAGAGAGGTAGTAPAGGGIGGIGGNPDAAGNTPASGAGGGGGGAGCNTTAVRAGGAGKPGKVILSYVLPGTGSSATIEDTNIGAITAGTRYKVVFKYKRVSGDGTTTLGVYVGAVRQGESSIMSTAAWTTETFYFTAIDSGTAKMKFTVSDSGAGSEFRFDQMSIKAVSARGTLPKYSLPADCTGVYYATLDGDPIWEGIDQEGLIGWYYDADYNEFCFTPSSDVIAGTNNLVVYYFTAQIPVYVVADILVSGGLYATQIAALTAMTYTETGDSIPRVWFIAGTSAEDAIRMLCEKCNFRFYFKYDGTPVFIPEPAIKGFIDVDAGLEQMQIASPRYYEDSSEICNVISVEGDKMARPVGMDQTMQSNYKGLDSDSTSITAYGDKTLSISNHLFQSDAVCLAAATERLAAYKDPKKYFSFNAPWQAIPLEIGDTIKVQVRLASVADLDKLYGTFLYGSGILYGSNGIVILHRGKIRDIKMTMQVANYILELAV